MVGISAAPFKQLGKPPGARVGRAHLRLLEHLQSKVVFQTILQPVKVSRTGTGRKQASGKFPAQAATMPPPRHRPPTRLGGDFQPTNVFNAPPDTKTVCSKLPQTG